MLSGSQLNCILVVSVQLFDFDGSLCRGKVISEDRLLRSFACPDQRNCEITYSSIRSSQRMSQKASLEEREQRVKACITTMGVLCSWACYGVERLNRCFDSRGC